VCETDVWLYGRVFGVCVSALCMRMWCDGVRGYAMDYVGLWGKIWNYDDVSGGML